MPVSCTVSPLRTPLVAPRVGPDHRSLPSPRPNCVPAFHGRRRSLPVVNSTPLVNATPLVSSVRDVRAVTPVPTSRVRSPARSRSPMPAIVRHVRHRTVSPPAWRSVHERRARSVSPTVDRVWGYWRWPVGGGAVWHGPWLPPSTPRSPVASPAQLVTSRIVGVGVSGNAWPLHNDLGTLPRLRTYSPVGPRVLL